MPKPRSTMIVYGQGPGGPSPIALDVDGRVRVSTETPQVLIAEVTGSGSDETAAINAAIDLASLMGGAHVWVDAPNPVYAMGIRLKDNVSLVVSSRLVLRLKANATTSLIFNDDVTNGNTNVGIFGDGVLDGNRANQTQESVSVISLQKVTGFSIDRVRVIDGKQSGINLYDCHNGRVRGVWASGAGNDNFLCQVNCSYITFSDCIGSGSVGGLAGSPNCCGFEADDGSRNITYTNCIAYDNLNDGFGFNNHTGSTGPFDIICNACQSYSNEGYGYRVFSQAVNGPEGVAFNGCIARANALDGFRTDQSAGDVTNFSCDACKSYDNGRYGFALAGTDDAELNNCSAEGNVSHGFNIPSGALRVKLSGCRAIVNTGVGFVIAGDDANLSGCVARANLGLGGGFTLSGSRALLSGCRSMDHQHSTDGRGYDCNGGTGQQLVGCVATGNLKDGLLIRIANARVGVIGGRYASNSTYGIRSLATTNFLRVIGVEAVSNTTDQILLHADGVNNVSVNNVVA